MIFQKSASVIEMQNVFGGLFSRLNIAKERITEPENMSLETSKSEMKREKKSLKKQNIQEQWDNYKKCIMHVIEREGRQKGAE